MNSVAERWRIVAIVEALLLTFVIGALIFVAATTQFTPYIGTVPSTFVQTQGTTGWNSSNPAGDAAGPVTAFIADTPATPSPAAITAAIGEWFTLARGVEPDNAINFAHTQFLYAMTGSAAQGVLSEYLKANNPFTESAKETIAISVDSIVSQGNNNYLVDWTEIQSDTSGKILSDPQGHPIGTQHWEAQIAVAISPPNDLGTIMHNPLGFYITNLSWTKKS